MLLLLIDLALTSMTLIGWSVWHPLGTWVDRQERGDTSQMSDPCGTSRDTILFWYPRLALSNLLSFFLHTALMIAPERSSAPPLRHILS